MVPPVAMLPDILQIPRVGANHLSPCATLSTSAVILRRCPGSEIVFPNAVHDARKAREDSRPCIEAFKEGEQAALEERLLGEPHRADGILRDATGEPADGPFAKERRHRTPGGNAVDNKYRGVHDATNFVGVDVLLEGHSLLGQYLEVDVSEGEGVRIAGDKRWDCLNDTVAATRDFVEIVS